MKRTVVLFSCLLILLCMPSTHFGADLKDMRLIDALRVVGSIDNIGFLNVQILYKNRDRDALIFWEKGEVICDYRIYRLKGDPLEKRKGKRITGGRRILKSFSESFPVKISRRYLGRDIWGLIECDVRIGTRDVRGSGKFKFKPGH